MCVCVCACVFVGEMKAAAAVLVEALDSDRKHKARQVSQVLYSKFEAELTHAIETHEVLSGSLHSVQRAAQVH